MYCAAHPDRQAAGTCTRCGRFFCTECLVVVSGRYLCRACVSAAFDEQQRQQTAATAPPPLIINNNANANANANAQNWAPYQGVRKSAGLAAFLSFLIPGLGQLYCGRIGRGILFFLGSVLLAPFFIGIGIWIWNIIDAYAVAQRYPMP